jgi:hypothetical protein
MSTAPAAADGSNVSMSVRIHTDDEGDVSYHVTLQEDANVWTEELSEFSELQAFCIGTGIVMALILGYGALKRRKEKRS